MALYELTRRARLGDVGAFISHSWSDDGDAKFDRLHEWKAEVAEGDDVLVWLDKSCIDQLQINTILASLPVFIAGCKQLVVLCGPTYATRLWW